MRDKANAEDIVRRWNSAITPRTKSYAVEAIYTTDQVEEIRRAAILAERERHAEIVLQELGDTGQARAITAAIREGVK